MDTFTTRYKQLNAAQKEAVDTIDGPVLVVAGPGTGKTQLLSMRVANILRTADVAPNNILCMTFTEDAANNMRQRLASIIGQAAYDVEIHTFHSFGASIIGRFGEFFYKGIGSQPIDELASHELFEELLRELPLSDPLSLVYEGKFYYLRGVMQAIDNFKSAGLAPTEISEIAVANSQFITAINTDIAAIMQGFTRIDAAAAQRFEQIQAAIDTHLEHRKEQPSLPSFVHFLSDVLSRSLDAALAAWKESGKTTALTTWKNTYLQLNKQKAWQLKETDPTARLATLGTLYEKYLFALRDRDLFDFTDMITRVVGALEVFDDLRLNLQEQYQYILVDEFQDTSLAQLRLIRALTDNPVFEGRPNILAVGDDDQAIYSFQGAELSNILNFHDLYRDVHVITLTENYRSHQKVLDAAQFVIAQSTERLVNALPNITKDIVAKNNALPDSHIEHRRFSSPDEQRLAIATEIRTLITEGTPAQEIAVIARNHKGLKAIVPFLQEKGVAVRYDKRENILESPPIRQLIDIIRFAVATADNQIATADALLPRIISYDFWGLATQEIWEVYLHNHRKPGPWLQTLQQSVTANVTQIGTFLLDLSLKADVLPLEHFIDACLGPEKPTETFTSPFRRFFLLAEKPTALAITQLELISHLRFLRDRLREYKGSEQLHARDLLQYIEICEQAGITLVDTSPHRTQEAAVQLFTAHASKGLEFGTVFIVDANQELWSSAGNNRGKIAMPANLPIERRAGGEDEDRRLLFVAITRAKYRMIINGYFAAKRGNGPIKFLEATDDQPPTELLPRSIEKQHAEAILLQQVTTAWHDRHLAATDAASSRAMLQPILERFRLSATDIILFTKVGENGPQQLFFRKLLAFPEPSSPAAAYGTAIHATLEQAHLYYIANGKKKAIEDLVADFERKLRDERLCSADYEQQLRRGKEVLPEYLAARYADFNNQEKFEFMPSSRPIVVEGATLSGKIDRVTPLQKDTFRVTDFKTATPVYSWDDRGSAEKLHRFKQQLAFYRILLEESNALGSTAKVTEGAIDFVALGPDGRIAEPLLYTPTDADIIRMKQLIKGIWQKVQNLDFPDTSMYPAGLKGILAFEDAIISDTENMV